MSTTYHPDPEINSEVEREANEAERIDMSAGYPPRWWQCPECGAAHQRGHFGVIGSHRCLACGYTGGGGVMAETRQELISANRVDNAKSSGKDKPE